MGLKGLAIRAGKALKNALKFNHSKGAPATEDVVIFEERYGDSTFAYADRKVPMQQSVKAAFEVMTYSEAMKVRGIIQACFNTNGFGQWPELAPSTVAAKGGDETILQWSQQLHDGVDIRPLPAGGWRIGWFDDQIRLPRTFYYKTKDGTYKSYLEKGPMLSLADICKMMEDGHPEGDYPPRPILSLVVQKYEASRPDYSYREVVTTPPPPPPPETEATGLRARIGGLLKKAGALIGVRR